MIFDVNYNERLIFMSANFFLPVSFIWEENPQKKIAKILAHENEMDKKKHAISDWTITKEMDLSFTIALSRKNIGFSPM